jgi:hypothetical protein
MRNAQLRACAHCNLHVRMLLLRQMQEVFNSIEHRAYELFESRAEVRTICIARGCQLIEVGKPLPGLSAAVER